jgi:hypothetical protein
MRGAPVTRAPHLVAGTSAATGNVAAGACDHVRRRSCIYGGAREFRRATLTDFGPERKRPATIHRALNKSSR